MHTFETWAWGGDTVQAPPDLYWYVLFSIGIVGAWLTNRTRKHP